VFNSPPACAQPLVRLRHNRDNSTLQHSAAFGGTRHRTAADLADLGTRLVVAWSARASLFRKDIARAVLQAARG
jgi:hypothetical protein